MIEDVVVALVFGLLDYPGLFQQVGFDICPADGGFPVVMHADPLAESGGVVVSDSLSVSESLEDWTDISVKTYRRCIPIIHGGKYFRGTYLDLSSLLGSQLKYYQISAPLAPRRLKFATHTSYSQFFQIQILLRSKHIGFFWY